MVQVGKQEGDMFKELRNAGKLEVQQKEHWVRYQRRGADGGSDTLDNARD